jgi:hypothetical protein
MVWPTAGTLSRDTALTHLADRRSRTFTHRPSHRKLAGDVISERITDVRAHRVGFIQLDQRISVGIRFPAYLLQIPYKMLTVFVDQKSMLARMVS